MALVVAIAIGDRVQILAGRLISSMLEEEGHILHECLTMMDGVVEKNESQIREGE